MQSTASLRGGSAGTAWAATPASARPYVPLALGNGTDCLVIGFTGSMCNSRGHDEQHQGLLPGWYKAAHRVYYIPAAVRRTSLLEVNPGIETGNASPVIQAGYAVRVDGEMAGVTDYRQTFDPRRATVTTRVMLRDVEIEVTAWLTDDSVWVERLRCLRVPANKAVSLSFFLRSYVEPHLGGLTVVRQSVLTVRPRPRDGALAFRYRLAPNEAVGSGCLWTVPAARVGVRTLEFDALHRGFEVTRFLWAVDDAPGTASRPAALPALCRRVRAVSPARLRQAHRRTWDEFSGRSAIRVPDPVCQGLYDFSLYWMRANQYPVNGSLNLGPFPCHWGGGCNAIPDAWSMQRALLGSNHLAESRRLLDWYRFRMPRARAVARALGRPGARLCYFASAAGQDYHADPEKIRTEKIGANAKACYSFYDHWAIGGRDDGIGESLAIMRELLDHAVAVAIVEREDRAYIGVSKPSYEGKHDVTNDSVISIWMERALRGYCEMAAAAGQPAPEAYRRIAAKLPVGRRENYRDGVLLPFRDAKFSGGDAIIGHLFNLPEGIDRKSVRHAIGRRRTTRSDDSNGYIGNILEWSWSPMWRAIIYSHWGQSRRAFADLVRAPRTASALGAIPEKIRLDGYPVNYGYTSAHAYYLWAVQNALCHDRPGGALALLPGLDGTWSDLAFDRLRMIGGLLVSLRAVRGRVRRVVLRNDGARPLRRRLVWNPRYAAPAVRDIALRPGETLAING